MYFPELVQTDSVKVVKTSGRSWVFFNDYYSAMPRWSNIMRVGALKLEADGADVSLLDSGSQCELELGKANG